MTSRAITHRGAALRWPTLVTVLFWWFIFGGCGGRTGLSILGSSSTTGSVGGAGGHPSATASSSTTGSVGGAGGDPSATASSSTAGSTGGAGGSPVVTVGDLNCGLDEAVALAPTIQEVHTNMGVLVNESGTVAAVKWRPPSWPWTVYEWTYRLTQGGVCQALDHLAIAYVGPWKELMNSPENPDPAKLRVVQIHAADLVFVNGVAEVTVHLNPPIAIEADEQLWRGVKLPGTPTQRLCVQACKGSTDSLPDLNSYMSATHTGIPYDCPSTSCRMMWLAISPFPLGTLEEQDWLDRGHLRFNYSLVGHP